MGLRGVLGVCCAMQRKSHFFGKIYQYTTKDKYSVPEEFMPIYTSAAQDFIPTYSSVGQSTQQTNKINLE
eukprot:8793674-Pyramimonas_sp.AAC.2